MKRSLLCSALFLPFGAAACSDHPNGPVGLEPMPPPAAMHAVYSDGGFTAIDLGTLGGTLSGARLINEAGQVVGQSLRADDDFLTAHAFVWENGVMTDLGTLGGTSSSASAINEAGQVVGSSRTADNELHALVWENGVMTDLGTLGGTFSSAGAINEAGQVVGLSRTAEGEFHATLWRPVTPVERLARIAADVGALRAEGVLKRGQARSLINKLNIATAMLNDGKDGPAIRQMEAFIHQVEGLVEGGVLTPEQGRTLIDPAQSLLDALR